MVSPNWPQRFVCPDGLNSAESAAMHTLVDLIAWLAARAGANLGITAAGTPAEPWSGATNADRAGRLVPVPQDGLEPEVSRSLGVHWALWLAVGLILLILAVGYVRRKWRARGEARPVPAVSLGEGRDEIGDAFAVVEIEQR
jgi:hypothetical protein